MAEHIGTAEVMRTLGVSRRTVDRYIERGILHPVYLPVGTVRRRRFDRAEVDAVLQPKQDSGPV